MKLTNKYLDEQLSQLTGKIVSTDICIASSRIDNIEMRVKQVASRVGVVFGT